MGTLIAVGEEYPLFQDGTVAMKNQDGAILEAFEDDGGFVLAIYLTEPTEEEVRVIRTEPIKTKLMCEEEAFVLPMIQFGETQMIFEVSFDPTLYDDNRAFQLKDKNNLLTIVLIDSTTGIVHGLRQANFPLKFIQHCSVAWKQAMNIQNYSERYIKWYLKLQQYSIEELWDTSVDVGQMGEHYDIEALQSDYYSNGQESN